MRREDYSRGAFSLVKNFAKKFIPTPALYPSSKNIDSERDSPFPHLLSQMKEVEIKENRIIADMGTIS